MADESVFVCLICVGPSAVLSERTPSSLAWNFSIINCSCIHQIRWNIHKFYYFFSAGWRTAPAAAAESDFDDDATAAVAATQRTYTLAFPSHTQFIYIFFGMARENVQQMEMWFQLGKRTRSSWHEIPTHRHSGTQRDIVVCHSHNFSIWFTRAFWIFNSFLLLLLLLPAVLFNINSTFCHVKFCSAYPLLLCTAHEFSPGVSYYSY